MSHQKKGLPASSLVLEDLVDDLVLFTVIEIRSQLDVIVAGLRPLECQAVANLGERDSAIDNLAVRTGEPDVDVFHAIPSGTAIESNGDQPRDGIPCCAEFDQHGRRWFLGRPRCERNRRR